MVAVDEETFEKKQNLKLDILFKLINESNYLFQFFINKYICFILHSINLVKRKLHCGYTSKMIDLFTMWMRHYQSGSMSKDPEMEKIGKRRQNY